MPKKQRKGYANKLIHYDAVMDFLQELAIEANRKNDKAERCYLHVRNLLKKKFGGNDNGS